MSSLIDKLILDCRFSKVRPSLPKNLEIPRIRPKCGTEMPEHSRHSDQDSSVPESRTCRVSEVKVIYEGELTCVYRATLYVEGSETVDVVIKTDIYSNHPRPDAFVREMEAYDRDLLQFQGMIIPRCYGLYQARVYIDEDDDDDEDDDLVSFLIIEYSGRPINFRSQYSQEFVSEVINKVANIHQAGFEHGDLDDCNILMDDNGNALFIDLEDVKPHKCGLKQRIIFDDLRPRSSDFGCAEMYSTAFMLGVWQEPCVKFYGRHIYLPFIVRGEAENLIARFHHLIDSEEQYAQAIKDAETLIEEIETWREWYNTITAEERHFERKPEPKSNPNPEIGSTSDGSTSDASSHSDHTSSASDTDSSNLLPSDLN